MMLQTKRAQVRLSGQILFNLALVWIAPTVTFHAKKLTVACNCLSHTRFRGKAGALEPLYKDLHTYFINVPFLFGSYFRPSFCSDSCTFSSSLSSPPSSSHSQSLSCLLKCKYQARVSLPVLAKSRILLDLLEHKEKQTGNSDAKVSAAIQGISSNPFLMPKWSPPSPPPPPRPKLISVYCQNVSFSFHMACQMLIPMGQMVL